jgi:hypothetical protein
MSMSSFFRALRATYIAEIDDLRFDSEGRDVLQRRLQQKRSQMSFLCKMIETAPEMVAVAFHGGFQFEMPKVMDHLLTLESDEFPDWDSLAEAVQLAPWAKTLAAEVLSEPQGAWVMTVAAGLEYLYHRPAHHHHDHHGETPDHDAHGEGHNKTSRQDHDFDADDDAHQDDTDHDQASANWLEGQGFDRKD